jgi:ATP-binding cassette subfamily B protein
VKPSTVATNRPHDADADASSRRPGESVGAYDARLVGRLWAYVRPYRAEFALACAFLPLTSAFALAQPYILKVAIDHYVAAGDASGLSATALAYTVVVAAEFLCLYLQYLLTMRVAQKSLADLRLDLFRHVQKLDPAFFDRNPVGSLVTRMTTDVDVINEMFAAGGMTILMDLVTLLGVIGIMFAIDFDLALASLALLPVMFLAINFFRDKARGSYRMIRERLARLNGFLQEAISGMAVIQMFAVERARHDRFRAYNDAHNEANRKSNIYEAALFSFVESMSSISFALIVWYGGSQILGAALALGTLVAFIEYVHKLFVPIRDFSSKYAVMQSAMTATERVFALLDTRPSIAASDGAAPRVPESHAPGSIEFRNVWFAYKDDDHVLRDVSFRVAPGETVAIVGPTGSGKTSIIKLLNRFYDVARGSVLVDGVDVREWDLHALRRRIALVSQDVFLFTGTIRDNISLFRPMAPGVVETAARAVNADRFIDRLPQRFEENLRERGNNLSVGQRQLLSFARALAHDPGILVLDEATSSVDPETETWIQEGLDELVRNRTSLVVAHRLSTIEDADRIVVLQHGSVREEGSHAELIRAGGFYARLHMLQRRAVGSHLPSEGTDATAAP